MLEAGSVRSKNTTNILVKNFGDLCLGVVAFCLVGYGLAFSEGNAWAGNEYFGLINLPYSLYPHVFMQVSSNGLKEMFHIYSSGGLCCHLHDHSLRSNCREDGLCWLPHHQVSHTDGNSLSCEILASFSRLTLKNHFLFPVLVSNHEIEITKFLFLSRKLK